MCQNSPFPIPKQEIILLFQNFHPICVFCVIQMCRRTTANCLILAAWEVVSAMGNDCAPLPFEWLSNINCQDSTGIRLAESCCWVWIPPAASSMASLAVRQRKQWDNSYSGRKLSSLTPASSRQQGYYLLVHSSLLGSPSYNPSAPAALVWIEVVMFIILQRRDCSRGMYLPVHCHKLWRSCCNINSSPATRWKKDSIQI